MTFNEEEAGWRIIGLVNTPEGQRIKLIRAESIGTYNWDNKSNGIGSSINDYGSNDWNDSILQDVLNKGAYYNRASGNCPSSQNGVTTECDFTNVGLIEEVKNIIDTITWNLGGSDARAEMPTSMFYEIERGTTVYTEKQMDWLTGETVYTERPTTWSGKIGLINPTDYGYATGGGQTTSRSVCLATEFHDWYYYSECYQNDWLYLNTDQWTLSPSTSFSNYVFSVMNSGTIHGNPAAGYQYTVSPVLFLKADVQITDGNGESGNPYELFID